MLERLQLIYDAVLAFIKNIPLTDLLVGVVVPIVAAWTSYFLAQNAIRKKENNKLFVQIELIRKELKNNNDQLSYFIDSVNKKRELDKALEFPLMFMKDFLINILDELQIIKESYMRSGEFLLEKPTKLLLLGDEKEKLDTEISKLNCQGYFDQYLDERRKVKLFQKIEQREKILDEAKICDKDIYSEFKALQSSMERQLVGDVLKKMESEEDNFVLAKFIYENIKEFNDKPNKQKEDVLSLYKTLVIFEIDSDIVKDSRFDQEEFDLFYKGFERPEGIEKKLYDLCEQYYKHRAFKELLSNYVYEFQDKRWDENSSDFVIINDRNLYISLVELYEKLARSNEISEGEDYEEKYQYSIECQNDIGEIMEQLEQHEIKLKKKCK